MIGKRSTKKLLNSNCQEAVVRHRFRKPTNHTVERMTTTMLSMLLAFGVLLLAASMPAHAQSASSATGANSNLTQTTSEQLASFDDSPEQLQLGFTTPVSWAENGRVYYQTQLTILSIQSYHGYQIQVQAPEFCNIELSNLSAGVATSPVNKQGSLYLAALSVEKLSGDVILCEIIGSFDNAYELTERSFTILELQVVTNISSNTLVTLGPDPAALIIRLSGTELTEPTTALAASALLAKPMFWLCLGTGASLAAYLIKRQYTRKATARFNTSQTR